MKSLLLMISSLGSVMSMPLAVFNKFENNCDNFSVNKNGDNQIVTTDKEWQIETPVIVDEAVKPGEWLEFAIDNINLTSLLGISEIDELEEELQEYSKIEIPKFFVRFFAKAYVDINGDLWSTDHKLGSEGWTRTYLKVENYVTMIIEKASTIWETEDNQVMMKLGYRASLTSVWPPEDPVGGMIRFQSGLVVRFVAK